MMKRVWLQRILVGAGLVVLTAASARAQVVQVNRGDAKNAVGFTVGGFFPTGLDSRHDDDTILADASELAFDFGDFKNWTFGGEYLFALGDFLEGGAGVSYYQNTVHSVYANLVNTNGSEIRQDLKFRILPITATIRFLPLGRSAAVQPYVGGGIGFFNWQYSEIGDFVDPSDNSVFSNRYVADGTAVGPVLLGGIRFPIGDAMTLGGEVRWQKATGDTGGIDQGFLGNKIDLGGTTANFAIHFRF